MRYVMITPDMTRVFCVTLVKENTKLYFLKEENIKLWFDDAVWLGYATAKSEYVINGEYLKPDQIEELNKENKIYELCN